MCLMDKDSKIGSYHGKTKKWWAKRVQDQFSSGFCLPSQGDAAEVFTALYLLFCGDLLRARSNEPNKIFVKFSVSLRDWVGTLVSGGDPPMVSKVPLEPHDDARPEINFIQVCRNYLRFDEKDMLDEQVLGDMYEGTTAYYCAANTPIFDLFASIRYKDRDGKIRYAPLLVQVKSTSESITEEIGQGLEKMAEIVKNAGYSTALCVFVRIGADTEEKMSEGKKLVDSDIDLFDGQIISKLLVVPRNDAFGLTTAFRSASFADDEISELLTSHRLIASLAQSANGMRLNKKNAFRREKYFGKKDAPFKFLTGFWESLRKSSDDGSKDPME
jgi:hypothetical protein